MYHDINYDKAGVADFFFFFASVNTDCAPVAITSDRVPSHIHVSSPHGTRRPNSVQSRGYPFLPWGDYPSFIAMVPFWSTHDQISFFSWQIRKTRSGAFLRSLLWWLLGCSFLGSIFHVKSFNPILFCSALFILWLILLWLQSVSPCKRFRLPPLHAPIACGGGGSTTLFVQLLNFLLT